MYLNNALYMNDIIYTAITTAAFI